MALSDVPTGAGSAGAAAAAARVTELSRAVYLLVAYVCVIDEPSVSYASSHSARPQPVLLSCLTSVNTRSLGVICL